jgi:hypothetical protein
VPPARRASKSTRGALGAKNDAVPGATGSTRANAERRFAVPIAYLAQLPRWLPFLVVVAIVLVAAFVGGVAGGVLLVVVAGLLAVLAYMSWPALPPQGRLIRVAAIGMVVIATVLMIRG